MNLSELAKFSTYRPTKGHASELYTMIERGMNRSQMQNEWEGRGRSKISFRKTMNRVKNGFIDNIHVSNKGLSDSRIKRFECWERYAKVKQLMIIEERDTAMYLAKETLALAEKYSLLDIRFNILKDLVYYFSVISPDLNKQKKYRNKYKEAKSDASNFNFAHLLLSELSSTYDTKKDVEYLRKRILELESITSDENNFNTFRFYTLSFWHRIHENYIEVVRTCETAIEFFSNRKHRISYSNVWTYYNLLVPIQIAAEKFERAERYSIQCLEFPLIGSQNWHNALFHRVLLGFYSDKPMIAFYAWKQASKQRMHSNVNINERWEIVKAYLVIYHLLGRISFSEPFRLRKFLNSVPKAETDKQGDNIAIIIAQLLLHLLSNDRNGYMKKSDLLPGYIHNHLRGEENKRAKCILHMMAKVESGNYYRTRTNLKAQRWARILGKTPRNIASLSELVPYEKVWEIVLSQLK